MTIPIGTSMPTSTTDPSNSTASANATLTSNFNTFLTLLTTQLKNQDPLSPMDTNQFTQQLVSYSEVEQQINTNTNLQQLISLQSAGESIAALPLVGKNIEYNSPTAPFASGGRTSFVYNLPSTASKTSIAVTDGNGNVVYSSQLGDTAAGNHVFTWNGETNRGGQAPAGDYTLTITASDANGNPVPPTIDSVGTVAAVGVQNGTANFTVGDLSIPLSDLVTVNPNLTQSN